MGERPELRRAYGRCRLMQLRHDPTFFWATQRLPSEVRPAVRALYGYVRGADEIVDGRGGRDDSPAARRAALDRWEAELAAGRAAGRSEHPVIAALVDAGERHALPLDELAVYMRSMRVDCGPVRIGDRDELDRYMDGSAAAVGRVMAPLLGATDGEQVGRLGVAFQLTNFIRDVREDWELDRVYLPGLPEADLARARPTPVVRARVAEEVHRARELFATTEDVPGTCVPAVRSGMRMARRVYSRVLDRVEHLGFDVVGSSGGLRPWQLAGAVLAGR